VRGRRDLLGRHAGKLARWQCAETHRRRSRPPEGDSLVPWATPVAAVPSECVAGGPDPGGARPAGPALKNIILMISDGCGYNHVAATDLYQWGKAGRAVYERFPFQFAMSTYAAGGSYSPALAWGGFSYVKSGATDSGAAATAMSCGAKTYAGAIGVGLDKRPLPHVLERCEELGKATGVGAWLRALRQSPEWRRCLGWRAVVRCSWGRADRAEKSDAAATCARLAAAAPAVYRPGAPQKTG